jgi:hypothetical protein
MLPLVDATIAPKLAVVPVHSQVPGLATIGPLGTVIVAVVPAQVNAPMTLLTTCVIVAVVPAHEKVPGIAAIS